MGHPQSPYDPAVYESSVREAALGQKFIYEGEVYQYCQATGAVTYVAQQVLTWDDSATFAASNDISLSEDKEMVAGFATMAYTENYYCLIKKSGTLAAAPKAAGDDTIPPGMPMVPHLTTDGTLKAFDDFALSTADSPTTAELNALMQEAAKICVFAHDTSDDTADTVAVRFEIP